MERDVIKLSYYLLRQQQPQILALLMFFNILIISCIPLSSSNLQTDQGTQTLCNGCFIDEFNDASVFNKQWHEIPWSSFKNTNGGGNNERQHYIDQAEFNSRGCEHDPITLTSDGKLQLKASVCGNDIISGKIVTHNYSTGFSHGYGVAEACMRLPYGDKSWPAWWALPINKGWPDNGEIDYMESVNIPKQGSITVSSNLHYKQRHGGNPNKVGETQVQAGGYHLFRLVRSESKFTWSVDGREIGSVTDLPGDHPYKASDKFYFIFNLAVCGGWPGLCNDSIPKDFSDPNAYTFLVDWVRFAPSPESLPALKSNACGGGSSNEQIISGGSGSTNGTGASTTGGGLPSPESPVQSTECPDWMMAQLKIWIDNGSFLDWIYRDDADERWQICRRRL